MQRHSRLLLAFGVLWVWGCVAVPTEDTAQTVPADDAPLMMSCGADVQVWIAFLRRVDALEGDDLLEEYTATLQRYLARPRDVDRVRLSYLLSRPHLPMRNVERSEVLLEEVDPAGDCAAYADLAGRLLRDAQDLDAAQAELQKLRAQLEMLKGIDADLTNGQEEFEELTP